MPRLTFSQLEQLWVANGGDPNWAPTMAAVALVESGGNTGALNDDPGTGDYSVGLWQINYYDGLAASRTQEYGAPANLQADPNAQARAAVALLGNGAGITNWQGDAAAKQVIRNGGPLTQQQAAYYAELQGSGGAGGLPTTAAGVAGIGAGQSVEGPRWLGLIIPQRCIFPPGGWQLPGVLGGSQICIVDAQAARKLKGYTVMALGGAGLLLGIVLVVAIGFKRGANTSAGKTALGIGRALPGPIGGASRAAGGGGRRARTKATTDPDTEAYEQGRRQAIRGHGRDTERRRITGAQKAASDDRERREGFPGYTS